MMTQQLSEIQRRIEELEKGIWDYAERRWHRSLWSGPETGRRLRRGGGRGRMGGNRAGRARCQLRLPELWNKCPSPGRCSLL